jgi:hypothetical protein
MSIHKRTRINKVQMDIGFGSEDGQKFETMAEVLAGGKGGPGTMSLGLFDLAALALNLVDDDYTNAPKAAVNKGHLTHIVGVEASRAMGVEEAIQSALDVQEAKEAAYEVSNDAALGDEVTRAVGIEGGLQTALDAEITRAGLAEGVNSSAISSEETRAVAAEGALGGRIDDVISNVDPAALDSLSELVTAFEAADSDLSAAITVVLGTHTSELAAEVTERIADVDAEETRALAQEAAIRGEFAAADTALAQDYNAQLESEAARAAAAEVANAEAITAEAVSRAADDIAIVATADALQVAVDAEITRALGIEGGIQSALDVQEAKEAAYEVSNDAALGDEITRASGVEAGLQTALDAEVSRALGIEGDIQSALDVQEAKEAAYEVSNDAALDAEITRAIGIEGGIQSALDVQEAKEAAYEVSNDAALGDEITRASGIEAGLQTALDAQEAKEAAYEVSNDAALGDEVTRAVGIEAGLQTALDAEIAAARAAEGVLGDRIDDVLSNVDPAALDSLTELVTAFEAADSDLSAAITAALGTHTSELATERTDRSDGDAAERAFALAARADLNDDRSGSRQVAKDDHDAEYVQYKSDAEDARSDGAAAERAFALAARNADKQTRDGEISDAKDAADIIIAALQADVNSNETAGDDDRALLRTDLVVMQNKWKRHTFPTLVAPQAAGTEMLFAQEGFGPMKQMAFFSMNGKIQARDEDYTEILNGSGEILGFSMLNGLLPGDSLSYFGEQALALS